MVAPSDDGGAAAAASAQVGEEPDDEETERPAQRRRTEPGEWGSSDEDGDGWDAPLPDDSDL